MTNSGVTLDTDNFKFGTASAKFANSSNNLKVTVPQALMTSSPWLVDCWFKVDGGQWGDYLRIFTQDDEQNGGWTYYLMSGNRVGVWVRNVTQGEPTSAALTPDDWHYATLVYYNAKFYGFVDGVRFTVQDGSTEGFLNYIMLGKRIQSTSYSLRGNIDEFRLQLLDESEISKWIGATIPVPDAPYSKPQTVGEWGKLNKAELALKSDLPGAVEWHQLSGSSAITLDRANGELQKVTLTQNCTLTAPVLDADHPTLLLQVTSSSAVTVAVGETQIWSGSGTFQVGWYWDGETTRRYPVAEVA